MSSALWWVTNGLAERAAGDRVEDRRLDLDEAAVLEPPPGERHELGCAAGSVRARLVGDPEVDVALAVAGVGVGDAVPLVGERAPGLGEQHPRRRPSPTARRVRVVMTSPVTPIQSPSDSALNPSKSRRRRRRANSWMRPAAVLQRAERELALHAAQHEPAGDGDDDRRSRCRARGRRSSACSSAAVASGSKRYGIVGHGSGHRLWFFSKMRRRPCRVSHGSRCWIDVGERARSARPGRRWRRRCASPSSSSMRSHDAVDLRGEAVDRARLDRLDGAACR